MQYAKDEIRQRIIEVAKQEFLENGFEKASIRTITAKAKTSKSNIYNYFKDKDHLFYSILEPTLAKIQQGLEMAKSFNVPKGVDAYTQDSQRIVVGAIMGFVFENITDFKLLLFQAQGSSLDNFKDKITEIFTDLLYEWVESIRPDKGISRFFVRCVANFIIGGIEQTIKYGITKEQVSMGQHEFISFLYHGWKGVFE